jgi:hypothetical protein
MRCLHTMHGFVHGFVHGFARWSAREGIEAFVMACYNG